MVDVQVGQTLNSTPQYRRLPSRAWLSPIKFEEKESWGIIDTAIVEAIVCMTSVDERASIQYKELVKRLHQVLHIEKKYLLESLPRLLRDPPDSPDCMIARFAFSPVPCPM